MKTIKNSQSGFSLIELMVVVAIIGILATIAVPQVNKFMAKAKQSEAKSTLSSIFTAESAFFTEYNSYYGSFNIIGYAPEGRVRYNAGFGNNGTCVKPSSMAAIAAGATAIATYCTLDPAPFGTTNCSLLAEGQGAKGTLPATSCTPGAFIAGAAGTIVNGAASVDTWSINQQKNILQLINGIP